MTAAAYKTRSAIPDDAPAIARIYNQGIEDRIATFETEPRTPADIAAWFRPDVLLAVAEAERTCHRLRRRFPLWRAVLLGFAEIGIHRRHGKLDGEWRDCFIVELLIGEAAV